MNFIKTGALLFILMSVVACGGKDQKANTNLDDQKEWTEAELLDKGDKLFRGKGNCTSCHMADKKMIGPSIREIVKGYDAVGADLEAFLRGKSDAIIEPANFSMMQPNLTITKRFSKMEMDALILYMRSL